MADASQPEKVTRVEVERIPNSESDSPAPVALGRNAKIAWTVIAVLSGIYIFVPEPSDVFPIVGWIDEGVAAMLLTTALTKLGFHIPILDPLLRHKSETRRRK